MLTIELQNARVARRFERALSAGGLVCSVVFAALPSPH